MDQLTSYLLGSVGQKVAMLTPEPTGAVPTPPNPMGGPTQNPLSELSMWQTWKKNGERDQDLRPLMTSLEPTIKSHVNRWKMANVPTDLIELKAQQIATDALKRYKPTAGYEGRTAAVNSWVNNQLAQLQRFVVENQNAGRIQERRAGKHLRMFAEAQQLLRQKLSRDPTVKELAQEMTLKMGRSVTESEARMFVREQRNDRTVSDENFTYTPTATRMLIKLLPEELTPIETQVFERLFGLNGCRKMKPGEIARDLRIDNSRVSRIRNKINEKAQMYL
jgi:DNA-directed RNA polymerase specialized sigma subunit